MKGDHLVMKLLSIAFVAGLALAPGMAVAQSATCQKLTVTGHPEYPPIAYRQGDRIVGAAAALVEQIAADLGIPAESRYTGSWADAQAAARDGKADIIFGIYFNDQRATYIDYVQPPFMIDPVVAMAPKGEAFAFSGRDDLVGKKGITNEGESYGVEFDDFMAKKLEVARSKGVDQAFSDLLGGKADYVIVGLYPGLAEAARAGVKERLEPLEPALLSADMFVAFSKKSPCLGQMEAFGRKIEERRRNGSFETMMKDATAAWDAAQKAKQ
jgi:polar amino acid transport system substrate-binding protein